MKKIFTHLFAVLLLSLVATSNVWAETFKLVPSEGTYAGTGSYCKTWTSSSEPVVTFSVAEANNMTVGAVNAAGAVDTEGNAFGIARGQSVDSNWTFSVAGYKILSYSFNYKLKTNSTATNIVITVNGNANAVTSDEKTLAVSDVNASAASFTLSGTNETIILTNVTIEAEPLFEDGKVYRFTNKGCGRVLGANGGYAATGVEKLESTADGYNMQLWYVEKPTESTYRLFNIALGEYLTGNTKSSGWGLGVGVATTEFELYTNGEYVSFRSVVHKDGSDLAGDEPNRNYMHCDGWHNVVGWSTNENPTLWSVENIAVDEATIDEAFGLINSLKEGAVYRFENKGETTKALSASGSTDVAASNINESSLAQQWLLNKVNGNWVFRNLGTGRYLCGNNDNSGEWSLVEEPVEFAFSKDGAIRQVGHNNIKGYMHRDGSNNIVSWCVRENSNNVWSNNNNTLWTAVEISYTEAELVKLLEKAPTVAESAAYITSLEALFTDAACVTPKLGSLAEAQTSDAYKALPTGLKAMVDKVYNEKTEGVAIETAWAEDNADAKKEGWSGEYAKKFRVQMYEPYSIAGDITSWLGINAHANNDNPTGIHVPEAGTLYVMVEGTINDGASLRIVDGGHNWRVTNATSGGYELSPGLNVINFTATAGQLYICYNVDTYNPDGATTAEKFPHKLSDYAPLKIHIEGGAINGYYNACGDFLAGKNYGVAYNEDLWGGVDDDNDWIYMETRANLNVIPLLAHRQILLFHLNDYTHDDGGVSKGMAYYLPNLLDVPATPYSYAETWAEYGMGCDASTGKINIMLEAWDRIMYSELATMGLVSQATMQQMNGFYPRWESDYKTKYEIYDYKNKSLIDNKTYQEFCNGLDYSEYFNHHGIALGTESGYMYGGWDHCGYNITTYNGIVQNMANNACSTWGPAHEIGHQHQALLTLNGLTEVTNNLFSNIALWYKGMSTSRYNGNDGSLERVLTAFNTEGSDIYTNNIWALTHLYYRLWLYYHLAGNNTQFWPRLYELLRQQPMQKGYNVSGDVSTLHFYKLACQAAGEDLTEFFRAHGYFSIMDDRLVGDYSNSVYEVSQEMIDEAIAEVKAMRDAEGNPLKENLAIIFICDDDENATNVQHDGVTKRDIYGETKSNSDFGSVTDFINGNDAVETTYTATVSADGTVTMSGGTGGVGFLVLNEKGEIVSFSNKSIFALGDEAAYLLVTGKASVVTVDTESTTTEAEVDVTAMRFALLQELIENAIALTQNTSETRVGFYKSSAVENLQDYVTMAQEVIANGDLANLQAVYELLYNEYNAVVANEFSRVKFVPGSKYAIINKSGRIMSVLDDGKVTTVDGSSDYISTEVNQWKLERDVAFRVKNVGKNAYLQEVTDENGIRFTVAETLVDYNITEVGLGWYALACSKVPSRYMNKDGADATKVITWGSMGDDNSQWKFILLEENETNAAKEELLELAKKTLALVDVVGTVEYTEGNKIELQSTNSGNANYIWSNAAVSGNDVDKLLDSDKNTFFHSQWNNSTAPTDGGGHHLTVDLGEDPSMKSFKFKFTTRNQSNLSNYPKTIEVYGSADNSTYTKLQVASGFATGAGVDNEAVVMGNGTAYRYLRFLVTDASGGNSGTNTGRDGKVFFHMSEFSLYPITVTTSVKSNYTSGVTSDAVMNAFVDAEQAKSVYNNASATIDDINAKKTALGDGTAAGSYTTLLAQYNNLLSSVLNAKKEQLKKLIDETNTLIGSVGSVTITPPAENELSLQVDNANGSYYLSTNSQESGDKRNIKNLIDGVTDNADLYFHTNWQTSVGADHHLLLDMGEDNSLGTFTFKYTTRDNSAGIDAPKTIVVEGSNDNSSFTTIATLTGLPTGQHVTYTSETLGTNQNKYRYVRFRVTDGVGTVNGSSYYYFAMSEFDVAELTEMEITVTNNSSVVKDDLLLDTYLATAKSQKLYDTATTVAMLDAAIADQQAAKAALEEAMNNTAPLKEKLLDLIEKTQALYDKMADAEGNVNGNYSVSSLLDQNLVDALEQITAAQTVYDKLGVTVSELETAFDDLDKKYQVLLAVENDNVAATKDKTDLDEAIDNAEYLLNIINGNIEINSNYYATATGIAIDELQEAYDAAVDAFSRYYLTEAQYTAALNELNNCYTTTNDIVALDVAKDELNNLIATMQTKLEEVTVSGAVAAGSLPLQVDNSSKSYYICTYPRATDDNGLGALIDEIDGVANTGTFAGTYWQSSSEAYSHYVEVDLGANIVLEDLAIDYTTRVSGAADSRPTGLKFYGSNDQKDYTELFSVTEGLPSTENTKWEMAAPYELARNYRYIRVAVASSRGGCFNMSDFNLYANSVTTVNEFYSTSDIFDCLPAVLRGYRDAKDAVAVYLTQDEYDAAKTALQAHIDALQAIVDGNVTDKKDLETLVGETEPLVTEAATISTIEEEITMQCTDENAPYYLYCNADGTETNGDGDRVGVAALVGDNATNSIHLHTTYNDKHQDDDLDHYLRLDMGENEAMVSFKFRYTGRTENVNNAPTKMLIEGSNDLENFDKIATLDIDVPESGTATYSTENALGNGKAYRYIRFMVKDTKNHASNNGHPFFVLSQFAVTACKTIEVNENYALNLQSKTLATAYNEVYDANIMVADKTHYVTREAYETALDELQKAKNALSAAMLLKDLPVKLTTDVNNPVLYKIKIKSNENVFTYEGEESGSSKKLKLDGNEMGNRYQAWYFMQGNNSNSYEDILIIPYWYNNAQNTTLKLGYPNINEGTESVASTEGAMSYNWYLKFTEGKTAEGYWNLQPEDGASVNAYVNQYGGGSATKLAFWLNTSNPESSGSQFQFIPDETDYSLSDAYYALYNKHAEFGGTLTGGEAIGDYTVASVAAYNEAYNNAGALLETKTSTDDVYTTARETLADKFAEIKYVMPEEGKLYMIKSISTQTYCSGKYVHALCDTRQVYTDQNHKHLVFDALGDITQLPLAVFTFENVNETNGVCKMKNLHTGMYVKSFNKGEEHMTTDYASAASVKIGNFVPGQAILRIGNNNPMHAQDANRVIVSWGAAAENASLWSIDEVTDISQVVHNVTMSAKFSSVMLGYNATVPAGVKAYIATGISGGYVTLEKIADGDGDDNVIPANTPVILYRTDDETSKVFTYSEETPVIVDGESLLGGSLFMKYVECEDGKDYYKLMLKDGEAKMYWMFKEFNANGESTGANDEGGHIKCSANKIYMALPNNSGSNPVTMFGMRFIDDSATGVDGVKGESGEVKAIYDLQGRKLTEITEPGMYIVDGKKVYVK